jgi:phosphatidylinositol alpha-1,6-mannosyltransferase
MPVRRVGNSVEGFGISYLEAAWFGVPALGGQDCGAADAVLDHETGLLCDGADQAGVTQALARLLDDEAWRRRLGEKARTRVCRELLWPAVLPRYLAAINVEPVTSRL